MISPRPQTFWRAFAQGFAGVFISFAMVASPRHASPAGRRQPSHGLRSLRCYPSPSLRSGPSQAGPILMFGSCNSACAGNSRNRFQICDTAVKSGAITTTLRGSTKCRSRFSSSVSFPPSWPVACRILRRAAWPARLRALWSQMLWTKTCLPLQPSAVLPVSRPAGSSWACRAATTDTKPAAFGRVRTTEKTIRADRPGGLFLCA